MTEDKQFETLGLQATSCPATTLPSVSNSTTFNNSPLHRMPPYLKRKHDLEGLDHEDLVISEALGPQDHPTAALDTPEGSLVSVPVVPDGSKRLCLGGGSKNTEDKENSGHKLLTVAKKSPPPPLSASPTSPVFASKSNGSSASSTGSSSASSSEGDENDDSGIKDINDDDYMAEDDQDNNSDNDSDPEEPTTRIESPQTSPVVHQSSSPDVHQMQQGSSPKVIVEHQPLPSIYELTGHGPAGCNDGSDVTSLGSSQSHQDSKFDSGLSEDEDVSDVSDDEDESDGEDDETRVGGARHITASPLFDQVLRPAGSHPVKAPVTPVTPKVIYNDRFWNQGSFGAQNTPQPPAVAARGASGGSAPFQFLQESGNRIECAENGKSYLQLGTIAPTPPPPPQTPPPQVQQQQQQQHPHVPVTPISQLQPKHNLVYRRGPPVPPPPSAGAGFRGGVQPGTIHLQQARPVCDHTNCLQRKQSFCYKSQRSRMLSMSLHKLHMARQNHEGCLRRSVLICNMLRYIEDESEKEAFQEQTSVAHQPFGPPSIVAPPPPPPPPPVVTPPQPAPVPQAAQTTDSSDHYWPPSSNSVTEVSSSGYTSLQNCVTVSQPSPMLSSTSSSPEGSTTALKDFNSAFRTASGGSTYSLPEPVAPAIVTSADLTVSDGLSSLTTLTTTSASTPASEGSSSSSSSSVGINWGSVLSLGTGHAGSDLDCPMNNNLNTDGSWNSTSSSVVSSLTSADLDAFDDLGWKLGGGGSSGNPNPTDDIVALKTFQSVEHVHQGAQQQQPTM